jgi:Arc/MetJ family transcription regulator
VVQELARLATLIDARRRVLEWRDRHTLSATLALESAVASLNDRIDAIISEADWRDGWFQIDAFIEVRIDPVVRTAVERASRETLEQARRELGVLIDDLAIQAPVQTKADKSNSLTDFADAASSFAPIVGGFALAGATPALAITTVGGFLGLTTVSIVSWPVAIGLGGVAAAGIGLGLHRAAGMKQRQDKRLRRRVDDRIRAVVFGRDDSAPSARNTLIATIEAGSSAALKRLGDASS